jgi:DMSO reductase family type II enzyme chaperone
MARSAIYNTLSLCFTYPDGKVCSWILEGKWIEEIKEAASLLTEGGVEKHLQSLNDFLAGEREAISLELSREYTRLFINAFPHVVAPPYGSVYMEKDGLVFGKFTSEVLRFYHETGLTLKEDLHDLPDHIAHELEFMGILTAQEAQASGSEKVKLEETQMNFLSRFVLPWVPSFCQKLSEKSRLGFYRILADLTGEFIQLEKNYLGVPEEMNSEKSIEVEIRGG